MRVLTGLFLLLSFLVLSGTPAFCDTAPPQQFQLQHAPSAAQNNAQAEDIRDIKGPVPLSGLPGYLIPALAGLGLCLAAVLLFFFLRRRKRPKMVASPPDVIALTELDRARGLMERPLVYAERVSAILRQYIEARFQIRSTRQTTREFFARLQDGTTIAEVDIKNHAGDLQECMEQCDMAKFAHGTPNQEGMTGMDKAIRNFIETTRQIDISGVGIKQGAS
jgi:hypothetical protein